MAGLSSEELHLFISSALHALRAPLSRIYCAGQELRDSCADSLDENGLFFADSVCQGSEEMEAGFAALSEISGIYVSATEMQVVPVASIMKDVLAEVGESFPARKVTVNECVESLWGDRVLLQRAVLALVENALRFSAPVADGVVTVSFVEGQGGGNEIVVKDNGVGFDMARLSRLFVPLGRLHRKEGLSGPGVGLALVKAVAVMHEGAVGAEGTPGGGATFRLILPGQK